MIITPPSGVLSTCKFNLFLTLSFSYLASLCIVHISFLSLLSVPCRLFLQGCIFSFLSYLAFAMGPSSAHRGSAPSEAHLFYFLLSHLSAKVHHCLSIFSLFYNLLNNIMCHYIRSRLKKPIP